MRAGLLELLEATREGKIYQALEGVLIRNVDSRGQGQGVVDPVVGGDRVAILHVQLVEQVLDYRTPVCAVVLFNILILASDFEDFATYAEWMPFLFMQILQSSVVVSDHLMEDVLVVHIGSSGAPSKFIIYPD